ncbi:hypothetical protein MNBD_GAMMA21-59 [hydrothermal vent metagenome]|uniref:Nucleotide-diphospho-sugar transferase domain-containing protein n=1 Tax=hydrothermal vent metagenome TaxID=652676 RepID=A0A3B0ZB41_9ZZZZ
MHRTLILQSHTQPLPYPWIETCLDSVRDWSEMKGYEYRFVDDLLFELVPEEILNKTQYQKVVATDLARLLLVKKYLNQNYEVVVWLDADFLIFSPAEFDIPDFSYAVGREVWVQENVNEKLRIYKKVHNAFLMFSKNNSFLDFYTETAQRLILNNTGTMPPQFIGPKLLTALHNVCNLPVMETAGMLSPMVIKAIISGEGMALQQFRKHSPETITGANLCISSCNRQEVSAAEMAKLISILSTNGMSV